MTEKQLPLSQVIGVVLLCVITTLAKPNFTMNLLPALGIYTLYRMWMKQYIDWRMLLVGFLLPCSLVLGWQFVFTYQLGANMASDQKVIFAPFAVYRLYSDWLFPKFTLSILFPLGILLLYHREACRKVSIQLAWLIFLVGAFYSYFMAEQGKNLGAGNFTWNAQIGLFILFVVTTLFFVQRVYPNQRLSGEESDKKSRTKVWLGWTLYGLH